MRVSEVQRKRPAAHRPRRRTGARRIPAHSKSSPSETTSTSLPEIASRITTNHWSVVTKQFVKRLSKAGRTIHNVKWDISCLCYLGEQSVGIAIIANNQILRTWRSQLNQLVGKCVASLFTPNMNDDDKYSLALGLVKQMAGPGQFVIDAYPSVAEALKTGSDCQQKCFGVTKLISLDMRIVFERDAGTLNYKLNLKRIEALAEARHNDGRFCLRLTERRAERSRQPCTYRYYDNKKVAHEGRV